MTVISYALGQLSPVLYFENSKGDIALPPTTDDAMQIRDRMRERGYELCEAGSLPEIDRLQKRIQDQEYRVHQAELERHEITVGDLRRQTRDRLIARMVSSSTRPYEREFIRHYLMVRDDKRAKHQKRFGEDQMYFTSREFNESNAKHRAGELAERAAPNSSETACTRCHEYRKLPGENLCFRCFNRTP